MIRSVNRCCPFAGIDRDISQVLSPVQASGVAARLSEDSRRRVRSAAVAAMARGVMDGDVSSVKGVMKAVRVGGVDHEAHEVMRGLGGGARAGRAVVEEIQDMAKEGKVFEAMGMLRVVGGQVPCLIQARDLGILLGLAASVAAPAELSGRGLSDRVRAEVGFGMAFLRRTMPIASARLSPTFSLTFSFAPSLSLSPFLSTCLRIHSHNNMNQFIHHHSLMPEAACIHLD